MGILNNIAEDGQTWAHRMRMICQVFKLASIFALLITLLHFGYAFCQKPVIFIYASLYYLQAYYLKDLLPFVSIQLFNLSFKYI